MERYDREGVYQGEKSPAFSLTRRHDVPHYYGDVVRILFLAVAVISAIAIPIVGDLLPFGTLVQVGSALVLVLLAGLTNPHGRVVAALNTIVAAAGALLVESVAIARYAVDTLPLFMAREAAALIFLFAFYYSVKTLRAMMRGTIGKTERPWEFEDTADPRD